MNSPRYSKAEHIHFLHPLKKGHSPNLLYTVPTKSNTHTHAYTHKTPFCCHNDLFNWYWPTARSEVTKECL